VTASPRFLRSFLRRSFCFFSEAQQELGTVP
jgi:hypothetical protein